MSWKLRQRYVRLLKAEKGTILKSRGGKLTVALVYPNTYRVGMSNLGFQQIYFLLNREKNILCERSFLPAADEIEIFKKNRLALFSLESQIPLKKFDLLAFSVSFENDYLNILKILSLAQITFPKHKRREDDPLIVAGGICLSFNPEPLTDFLDLILVGEGEKLIPNFIRDYLAHYGKKKGEILSSLNRTEGIYIPPAAEQKGETKKRKEEDHPFQVKRSCLHNLDLFPTCSRIITPHTIFSNTFLIETGRGCPRSCSFCLSGHLYPLPRFYGLSTLINQIRTGEKYTDKIGLVGSAIADHPELAEICREIGRANLKLSVSSLRLDGSLENLLKLLGKSGCQSISFAPEAGSSRLRKLINKDIPEEKIMETVSLAIQHNLLNLKFYFLIGLPREEKEDLEAICELAKKIKRTVLNKAKKNKRLGKITISINPFVPKPFTPFERIELQKITLLQRKLSLVKDGLGGISNLRIISERVEDSFIQGLLSRGDRKIGKLIVRTFELEGDWFQAIKQLKIDPAFYRYYRSKPKTKLLPWKFIAPD